MKIENKIMNNIISVCHKYNAINKVVLFGSRARGDNNLKSDIDLAIYAKNNKFAKFANFVFDMENIKTLLKFDIVLVDQNLSEEMIFNIKKEGVILLKKNNKLENLTNATERLKEAIEEASQTKSTVLQDGVIQRFEFCVELAWKAAQEFLNNEGFAGLNSPKSVMKEAFSFGLIHDDQSWITMLDDRNLTSHIYKQSVAKEVYERIRAQHYKTLQSLLSELSK